VYPQLVSASLITNPSS